MSDAVLYFMASDICYCIKEGKNMFQRFFSKVSAVLLVGLCVAAAGCGNFTPSATEVTLSNTAPSQLSMLFNVSVTNSTSTPPYIGVTSKVLVSVEFFSSNIFVHFNRGESLLCDAITIEYNGQHDFTGELPYLGPAKPHTCIYTSPNGSTTFTFYEPVQPLIITPHSQDNLARTTDLAIFFQHPGAGTIRCGAFDTANRNYQIYNSGSATANACALNTTALQVGSGAITVIYQGNRLNIQSGFRSVQTSVESDDAILVHWI